MIRILTVFTCLLAVGLAQAQGNTLSVVQTGATSLDPDADFWSKAPVLEVQTRPTERGGSDGLVIRLQAVHDGEFIAIRAEWPDPTESIWKKAWTFDGTTFTKSGDDEDRFLLAFPIQNNAEFASKGCAAACHSSADNRDEWWMGSDDAAVTYDNWHWKAARNLGAGYMDDKWWTIQSDPTDVESGQRGDTRESGGETSNVNAAGTGPMYMAAEGPGATFILAGQAVELDTSALSAGDVIPGYLLERPVGSRGDISATGVWQDGHWVLVMRRLLDTGNDDDVAFTVRRRVPFGLAVVDNGGGFDHRTVPDVLILDWR